MDIERCDYTSERALLLVTSLYSASLIVSNSFSEKSCQPMVPFGECVIGEIEGRFKVASDSLLQYSISFVIAFFAGVWSDSHGRRRRPLIFLPIVGQIVTDGLYFVNGFWYWPSTLDTIFTSIIPGLFVGRNMFWIGVISYVSENSAVKSRTLKLGTIITTYTISSLLGSGVVALLKFNSTFYYRFYFVIFLVPIMFNIIAIWVGHYHVKDTSDPYNEYIIWLEPRSLIKGFTALFENKLKTFAVSLAALMICESLFVTRIGLEYSLIMRYIHYSTRWYGDNYVYFNIAKMLSVIFGTVFFIAVLSNRIRVSDLAIGLSVCFLYIVSAVLSVVPHKYWQHFLVLAMDFCHGAALTITTSLTSKMVEAEQLGRLNSIQTSLNSLFTFGMIAEFSLIGENFINSSYETFYNISLVIFVYVILMLPITYTFMILYSKYKEFWSKETFAIQNKAVYTVNQ